VLEKVRVKRISALRLRPGLGSVHIQRDEIHRFDDVVLTVP